jgi:hypothetical protein
MTSSEHPIGRRISRQWLMVALSICLALAVAVSMALAGDAEARKKKARSYTRTSPPVTQTVIPVAVIPPAPGITFTQTPYTFERTGKIRTINNVSATLTAASSNGNDEGLVLGLDGIDTGIRITGLAVTFTPVTVTGTPQNQAQIVQALKADGQLVGSVIDRTPSGNQIATPNTPTNTTLQLKGKLQR